MNKIKIGITHGDINGISYEVIIKTFLHTDMLDLCIPVLYGSPKVLAYYRKAFNSHNPNPTLISTIKDVNHRKFYIINCISDEAKVEIGKSSDEAGAYAIEALQRAVEDLKFGELDALVTAPINKKNIQSDKFKYRGHTEFLAKEFNAQEHLMLLVSEDLKIGVVTEHIPLSEVSEVLSTNLISEKLNVLNKSLINDFGIRKPKIAVMGVNPHAGDEGIIGNDEKDIIIPAIENARKNNIMAIGPYPSDGFFGSLEYKKFDAVLAMYHDQGLIPFKMLSFENGINYTAGLPIIRTSPAHGTAFEIAGKNIASEESFRNAIYYAIDIFKNRENQAELTKNQLATNDLKIDEADDDIIEENEKS